jgi:hypothetical protein
MTSRSLTLWKRSVSRPLAVDRTKSLSPILQVYPLLSYADLPVQRSLYHILRKSIQIRTAALVVDVEADLTSAAERLPELPEVLLSLAGQAQEHKVSALPAALPDWGLSMFSMSPHVQTNAGNLLAWLLIFEHFVGAVSEVSRLLMGNAKPSTHTLVQHPSISLHRSVTKR